MAGAEEQVIGIGKDYLGVEFVLQIPLHDAFDGGLRAHRHEYGSVDDSVSGVDPSGTSARIGTLGDEFKMHCSFQLSAKT